MSYKPCMSDGVHRRRTRWREKGQAWSYKRCMSDWRGAWYTGDSRGRERKDRHCHTSGASLIGVEHGTQSTHEVERKGTEHGHTNSVCLMIGVEFSTQATNEVVK